MEIKGQKEHQSLRWPLTDSLGEQNWGPGLASTNANALVGTESRTSFTTLNVENQLIGQLAQQLAERIRTFAVPLFSLGIPAFRAPVLTRRVSICLHQPPAETLAAAAAAAAVDL